MNLQKLLIIGRNFPEPNTTAAGNRMMQLIHFFQEYDYQITFATTAQPSKYSVDLNELDITTLQIELNNSSFDVFVRELQPHIVLFDRFISEEHFGWRVAEHAPNALRILDTEDLHFLREAREKAIKNNKKINLFTPLAQREVASIYRCDMSLIISEYEMELLKTTFKINEHILFYLPFLVEEKEILNKKLFPSFKERRHFISVGNFLHAPNLDAVVRLKKEIWTRVKEQLPNAELHIYGAYAPQQILEFHKPKEGFIVKGWTKNINNVMQQARVCLAPIRYGAGLKGKLLDAMLNGLPVITSPVGAEGMYGNFQVPGAIAENDTAFIEKAIELYCNESIWNESLLARTEILNHRFERKKFTVQFSTKLKQLNNNIENHRNHNIVGNIILNSYHNSIKYMSKWIEEKNK